MTKFWPASISISISDFKGNNSEQKLGQNKISQKRKFDEKFCSVLKSILSGTVASKWCKLLHFLQHTKTEFLFSLAISTWDLISLLSAERMWMKLFNSRGLRIDFHLLNEMWKIYNVCELIDFAASHLWPCGKFWSKNLRLRTFFKATLCLSQDRLFFQSLASTISCYFKYKTLISQSL